MDNKICVYAIAKNEEQFVDRWMDSMLEADYVVVLDTGSDDETVERLKARGAIVEQKVIDPWRFDVARNESMKLIPEDANILVCTDLDEFFEPGWADALRTNWVEGEHVTCWYKYAWSHTDSGEPARVFYYNKITDRSYWWEYPVHEGLKTTYSDDYVNSHALNLFDDIFLHHFPDRTKSRSSYLPLLELRAEESPEDSSGLFYLSHEYNYQGLYQKSIDLLNRLLTDYIENFTSLEIAACYLFLGDNYHSMGETYNAINCYLKAIEIDSTYREPYLHAAELYNELGFYEIAIGLVKEAIAKSYRHYNWLERDSSWAEQVYDILSISYFYTGNIEQSYINVMKAYQINSTGSRIIYNKEFIENAFFNN